MNKEKGIAYCGLACCICSENTTCAGCRNEGCKDKEWCKNYNCCRKKGINGCWECGAFPCQSNYKQQANMLDKLRIRAFAKFIKKYGAEKFMECIERNEKAGIVYHYKGQLIGDYDLSGTEEEIMDMILQGI